MEALCSLVSSTAHLEASCWPITRALQVAAPVLLSLRDQKHLPSHWTGAPFFFDLAVVFFFAQLQFCLTGLFFLGLEGEMSFRVTLEQMKRNIVETTQLSSIGNGEEIVAIVR